MAKNWYVIHTYAGYEGRVRTSLVEQATQMGLEKEFGQVLVLSLIHISEPTRPY